MLSSHFAGQHGVKCSHTHHHLSPQRHLALSHLPEVTLRISVCVGGEGAGSTHSPLSQGWAGLVRSQPHKLELNRQRPTVQCSLSLSHTCQGQGLPWVLGAHSKHNTQNALALWWERYSGSREIRERAERKPSRGSLGCMVISPVEASPAGKRQAVRWAAQEGGQGSLLEPPPSPPGKDTQQRD